MLGSRKKGETLTFQVDGIRCAHCEATIKIALRNVPGVQRVDIRYKKQVRVEVAQEKDMLRAELQTAIERSGYKVIEAFDG
jgi:copper chaperone CopZ